MFKSFDDLAGSRLNPDKIKVVAPSSYLRKKARDVTFEGHSIVVVKHLKGLGSTLAGCYQQSCKDADARAVKAIDTAKRSKRSLAP